jgi:hypothetical protein
MSDPKLQARAAAIAHGTFINGCYLPLHESGQVIGYEIGWLDGYEEASNRHPRWVEEDEYEKLFQSGEWKSVEMVYRGRRLWLMCWVPPIPAPGKREASR